MMNEMVLERTSNLVMPSHYVELDNDEMSYVEGGIYISNGTIQNFMSAAGLFGANILGNTAAYITASFGSLAAGLSCYISAFFSWFITIPVVGKILFLYVALNAVYVAGKFIDAIISRKGVDLYMDTICWFIPCLKADVR